MRLSIVVISSIVGLSSLAPAQDAVAKGLRFRALGPALTGGRITDLAVEPGRSHRYYLATASGGIFRTVNAGTTWSAVFDDQGSYSIGCLALDPTNPNILWVGTGENNSQRSVAFGDGIYKTKDGGRTWSHLGLRESEHIGSIAIHPHDPQEVLIAAQGPLWRSGGDRGVYKTNDGGATFRRVLHISEHTGVNEVVRDPSNPSIVYCSAYQRQRRVWTLLNGGPESAIYKSEDGGETWRRLDRGLPSVDKGRIGLAIPVGAPQRIYAIVEAARGKGGVFRSDDSGENWIRTSSYMTSSPQYYNEIVADPHDPDRLYALDTFLQVSEDAGVTFRPAPGRDRHVDDHALWIDPLDPDHLLVGCDGGLYESWDRAQAWQFRSNLSLAQFYRVTVDDAWPFYNVYGGTQDNNSLMGPSRTLDRAGITNEHWRVTVGGDGYETVVDGADSNILYCLWQYGGLVRHDLRSGEIADIKPRERAGEDAYRFNWDTPLLRSPHHPTRIYVAAQKLFRSDDRGQSWDVVSPDLSRGIDRNTLPVMGRVWEVDAVAKNSSTSFYGGIVALDESPLTEGLLYVGTDDGLLQMSPDGGRTWVRTDSFPEIPERTYVSDVMASRHHPDRVYVTFDGRKDGVFTPWVLRSDDRGRSFRSVRGDLPDRHPVYCIVEDHVRADLLFLGTEFGVFATVDGGEHWVAMKNGLPTIAVRDLDIQRRENDLVAATFGRGFYVLDDYAPLQQVTKEALDVEATIFPIRRAWAYVPNSRLGNRSGRGSQGASFYAAANPQFGASISYHLAKGWSSLEDRRRAADDRRRKANEETVYPTWDELRAEDAEIASKLVLVIRDERGNPIRQLPVPQSGGFHRVTWDLRYPTQQPIRLREAAEGPEWEMPTGGRQALPGRYTATLESLHDATRRRLAGPAEFVVTPLDLGTLRAGNRWDRDEFTARVATAERRVGAIGRAQAEVDDRLRHCRRAVEEWPGLDVSLLETLRYLERRNQRLSAILEGDQTVASRNEPAAPALRERLGTVVAGHTNVTSPPTQTHRDLLTLVEAESAEAEVLLVALREHLLPTFETELERRGVPWTPGRRWPTPAPR